MRARGLFLVATAALAACSSGEGGDSAASQADGAKVAPVACALAGAQAFAETCTVEQAQVEGAPVLVIRHADGGFRRFAVKDGGVIEADGAEPAVVTRDGATMDISVGADRYRLDAGRIDDAR